MPRFGSQKKNKFGAKKTFRGNISFPSKLEAAVYDMLKAREDKGEITRLRLQESLLLKQKCSHCGHGPIRWKVDFSFLNEDGDKEFVEAKGCETPEYKMKKNLFKQNPQGRLEIWKGNYKRPYLAEVIECHPILSMVV